jgi:hypothetical protein
MPWHRHRRLRSQRRAELGGYEPFERDERQRQLLGDERGLRVVVKIVDPFTDAIAPGCGGSAFREQIAQLGRRHGAAFVEGNLERIEHLKESVVARHGLTFRVSGGSSGGRSGAR